MTTDKEKLEKIKEMVSQVNTESMRVVHKELIDEWFKYTDLKLNKTEIIHTGSLFNHINDISNQLDLIRRYQHCIDICEIINNIIQK